MLRRLQQVRTLLTDFIPNLRIIPATYARIPLRTVLDLDPDNSPGNILWFLCGVRDGLRRPRCVS
jgi:hypothetical protein